MYVTVAGGSSTQWRGIDSGRIPLESEWARVDGEQRESGFGRRLNA